MCSPTSTSYTPENDEGPHDSPRSPSHVQSRLDLVLKDPAALDWSVVNGLLQELSLVVASSSNTDDFTFTSTKEDPLGRSLVSTLLMRNPPAAVLNTALEIFPESLRCNPVAFFTACKFAAPQTVALMMNHCLRTGIINSDNNKECPYPWILSGHISVDGAKAILQAYPQGVLQPSASLSSLCLLDFFLIAPEMTKQRKLDMTLWTKFKLMLVAAERCPVNGVCRKNDNTGLSPVNVILKRIFLRPDVLDNMERAQHVLWLLHQLRRSDRWVFENPSSDDDGGLYPLHYVLSHKCTKDETGLVASRELVKILLSACPSSARLPFEGGRLPIHMAVVNGWPCHDLLLSVYPESLDKRDPSTGFVPFQAAAAAAASGCDDNGAPGLSLDMTFELLRANPVHADIGARA